MQEKKRFYPHIFPKESHTRYGKTVKVFVYDKGPQYVSTQGNYLGYEPIEPQRKVNIEYEWRPDKIIMDIINSDDFLRTYLRTTYLPLSKKYTEIFYGLTFARRVALDNPELYKEIHDMTFTEDDWNMFMAWRFRTKVIDAQPRIELT